MRTATRLTAVQRVIAAASQDRKNDQQGVASANARISILRCSARPLEWRKQPNLNINHGPVMSLQEFREFRERMNDRILAAENLEIRRFFALDSRTYEAGALELRTKELLGLVASMVLRCDDCITYHLVRCVEEGASDEELFETFAVGLVVGGSIVIPHLRRAVDRLDEIRSAETS